MADDPSLLDPTAPPSWLGVDGLLAELAAVTDDFASLPEVATRAVGDLLQGTTILWVVDNDLQTIRMTAGWHPQLASRLDIAELGEGVHLQLGEGFLGMLLEQGRPFFRKEISTADLQGVNPSYREYFRRHGLTGMIIVPLQARGQHIGLIGISRHTGQATFTDADFALVQQVAGHLALAVDNARLLAVAREEIAERKRSERRLRYQATHDSLTGLPNRVLLRERLDAAVPPRNDAQPPALLFLDLDGFKDVNDGLGHEAGDAVLRQLAGRLMAGIPSGGFFARLGGDEFAVLLESSAADDPVQVAGQLRGLLAPPVWAGGQPVHLGGSIGIARAHTDGDEPADLMRRADLAMYRAKQTGEGVCTFDTEIDGPQADRLTRIGALRRAITIGDLVLHWQPVVDLASGEVRSVEALVRWHRRDLIVPPDLFVPLAEQSGLILPLTRTVVDLAADQAAAWRAAGRLLPIAINVATDVLAEPGIAAELAERFARGGIEPSDVTLEISEASLLGRRARDGVRSCAELGFHMAIDDFGTGYASFGYLKELQVDVVKIDRAFVRTLHVDARDEAIVGSISFVADRLGLRTVAEGVEHPDAVPVLRRLGVHEAQGFWLCRPAAAEDLEVWLGERQR